MSGFPLPPGSAIGILGGGQLGRMLSLSAAKLGFDVVILCPEENCPAGRVSRRQVVGSYDDPRALAQFSEGLAAVKAGAPVEYLAQAETVEAALAALVAAQSE